MENPDQTRLLKSDVHMLADLLDLLVVREIVREVVAEVELEGVVAELAV